ncbi:MAG: ribosome maturation factor RimP [Gammaproteobacteria bacterium]
MGRISATVTNLVESVVSPMGYELVGVEYIPQGKNSILRIFIDNEAGVVLEDCEQVSRQLGSVLDVEDPIKGQYLLEVSSPGLDRPMFKLADYVRFNGHRVKLRLHDMQDGRRKIKGRIEQVVEDMITLSLDDGEQITIRFDDIDKANLVPEF